VFIRRDLSHPQQVVQASHACIEATKAFLDYQLEHPYLVVLGVKDEPCLQKCANRLSKAGIQHKVFIEPDRDNESTAIATCPVFGEQRAFFKNYQCLQERKVS
jgi:hypothetical protein